jgi:hypothetical protein
MFPRACAAAMRNIASAAVLPLYVPGEWVLSRKTNVMRRLSMRVRTLTAIMLLSSATYAFAGGGAPVPEGAMKDDPSGRPGKILSEAECQSAWETAGPDGDTLSKDKATPFITNFEMVDTSKDAKISAEEWKEGCAKGWVSADANTAKDMEGTPADPAAKDTDGTEADPAAKDM